MLMLTAQELAPTDTADHALEVLAAGSLREVIVVGRRGPAQCAFTNPELLELGELSDADVDIDSAELERALQTRDERAEENITARRNVEILRDYATRSSDPERRRVTFRFMLSPVQFIGDEHGHVRAVEFARNELVAENGAIRAHATEQRERIDADLVFRAIGYRGIALPGVPFDERRGVIPNEGGRVMNGSGQARPGEYVVGWVKRGPTGVIGTNKKDAQETVNALLADVQAARAGEVRLLHPERPDAQELEQLLRERKPDLVTYEGWSEIDRHERAAGEPEGRPRVKLTSIDEMLRVAAGEGPDGEH
jgi:ferredoxin--NADP+ reductase